MSSATPSQNSIDIEKDAGHDMIVVPTVSVSASSSESLPSQESVIKGESPEPEPVTYTLPDKKGRSSFTRWLDCALIPFHFGLFLQL
jgi:hypothetical protein